MVLKINTIGETPSSIFDTASNKLLPPMINFVDLSTPPLQMSSNLAPLPGLG